MPFSRVPRRLSLHRTPAMRRVAVGAEAITALTYRQQDLDECEIIQRNVCVDSIKYSVKVPSECQAARMKDEELGAIIMSARGEQELAAVVKPILQPDLQKPFVNPFARPVPQ